MSSGWIEKAVLFIFAIILAVVAFWLLGPRAFWGVMLYAWSIRIADFALRRVEP